MANDLVIGVDGGGTKTVAWLAPLDDSNNTVVLGRGHAGPGNPRAAGFDVAQSNIVLAIEAAFANANLPKSIVAAACFGLAGAGREVEQQRIAAWGKSAGIAARVRVTGDAEPILAAASPDNCGIALICGTGSLAWGRNRAGQIARCGGWGYLLGDEGSGYAIALAGLRAAAKAADGRGEMTALLPRFQNELQAATAQDLIEQVYSPQMTRERLASLAHVVLDSAVRDAIAMRIVVEAASHLADLVNVLRRQLSLASDYCLALTGGVLLNETLLRELTLERIRQQAPPSEAIRVFDPVLGAVALARQMATA